MLPISLIISAALTLSALTSDHNKVSPNIATWPTSVRHKTKPLASFKHTKKNRKRKGSGDRSIDRVHLLKQSDRSGGIWYQSSHELQSDPTVQNDANNSSKVDRFSGHNAAAGSELFWHRKEHAHATWSHADSQLGQHSTGLALLVASMAQVSTRGTVRLLRYGSAVTHTFVFIFVEMRGPTWKMNWLFSLQWWTTRHRQSIIQHHSMHMHELKHCSLSDWLMTDEIYLVWHNAIQAFVTVTDASQEGLLQPTTKLLS